VGLTSDNVAFETNFFDDRMDKLKNFNNYNAVSITIRDVMKTEVSMFKAKIDIGLVRIVFIAVPRTAKEISKIFCLDTASATKGCKNALAIINNLEKDMVNKDKTNFGKTKPEAFIERYCSKLNINNELTKLCQFISMKIEKMDVMPENTPPSIAAGVVYFVSQICKLNVSKRDVKVVSETSEVTINKCYKKLEKISKDENIIPVAILKKYNLELNK
jgi:hypothetical protein